LNKIVRDLVKYSSAFYRNVFYTWEEETIAEEKTKTKNKPQNLPWEKSIDLYHPYKLWLEGGVVHTFAHIEQGIHDEVVALLLIEDDELLIDLQGAVSSVRSYHLAQCTLVQEV
jgi:hypothetical protein